MSISKYINLLLAIWSFIFTLPFLYKTGLNIVTLTYQSASLKALVGVNPYTPPFAGDIYYYPLFFSFFYYPFAILPSKTQVLAWCFLNAFVFWTGLSLFFPRSKNLSFWLTLALISMELDISLRYQQVNAFVAGLVLLSIGYMRLSDKAFLLPALFLSMASACKVFPIFYSMFFTTKKTWFALLAFLCIFAIVPVFFLGLQTTLNFYTSNLSLLSSSLADRELLDIGATLRRLHLFNLVVPLQVVIALSALLIPFCLNVIKRDILSGYAFVSCIFLLLSPKTESPTFVLMAPCYLYLWHKSQRESGLYKRVILASLLVSGFLTTFVYTSLWPRIALPFLTHHWSSKIFGVLLVWSIVCCQLIRTKLGLSREE